MAITTKDDIVTPQILIDAIRGKFRGKNAFLGSDLVRSGAVLVSGTMPKGGQSAIGKTIDFPYFGHLGEFVDNPDGSAVTPQKLGMASEQATVARKSIAVETSAWAQGVAQIDSALGDPYKEGATQAMQQAERAMDRAMVDAFKTTPLVRDIYSATVPVYMTWQQAIRAKTLWGDEADEIVAIVTHSQAEADLVELTDSMGRPLFVDSVAEGSRIKRFAGMPLVVSDRVPLDGSTMGTVVPTGTTPPVLTITGTPLGPWNLVIDCVVGGAHATATIRFSTDGGNTWSANLTTAGVGVALPLIDTALDSLVGTSGAAGSGHTGLSAAFAAGTFNADNQWTSTANLKVTTLIVQQGAGAFWYNAARLGAKTDVDILADTDILAMHLYYAAHRYRRRANGSRPGVIAIKHNVKTFVG